MNSFVAMFFQLTFFPRLSFLIASSSIADAAESPSSSRRLVARYLCSLVLRIHINQNLIQFQQDEHIYSLEIWYQFNKIWYDSMKFDVAFNHCGLVTRRIWYFSIKSTDDFNSSSEFQFSSFHHRGDSPIFFELSKIWTRLFWGYLSPFDESLRCGGEVNENFGAFTFYQFILNNLQDGKLFYTILVQYSEIPCWFQIPKNVILKVKITKFSHVIKTFS